MKVFAIDFVRQIIEQTLLEENIKYPKKYFGGKNQVNLFSFYEQLEKEDEVNRYVEIYRDLSEQQNRTGLIMNGTIIAPENPTISNLYSCLIVPMSFTCSFRVRLEDRDSAIETIHHLIDLLKGKKQDIALLNTGKLFKVGTVGSGSRLSPTIKNGDYIGEYSSENLSTNIINYLTTLTSYGFERESISGQSIYQYLSIGGVLKVVKKFDDTPIWQLVNDTGSYGDIIFPPAHTSFTKYKVSISCDAIRCDEPRNLNAKEYCVITFGGSATLVNDSIALGNDMVKLCFEKYKIIGSPDFTFSSPTKYWLEPLEMPNGTNADTKINQLMSNNFVSNTHTNAIGVSMQYTFMYDKSIDLLKQFFKYSRYGTQGTLTNSYVDGITPNLIYQISELWCSWGNIERVQYKAKVVESIDVENTESDCLSLTIPLQVQGDNN